MTEAQVAVMETGHFLAGGYPSPYLGSSPPRAQRLDSSQLQVEPAPGWVRLLGRWLLPAKSPLWAERWGQCVGRVTIFLASVRRPNKTP